MRISRFRQNELREVVRRIRAQRTTDGGGVHVNRLIGTPTLDSLDPFLLLDELRSNDPDDYIAGFPDHPHRGFENFICMLAGRMRHYDNQGNSGVLEPGSVQWMTAGRGIRHSAFPNQAKGLLWCFQLWINMPANDKFTTPRSRHLLASAIPQIAPCPGVRARVIAGRIEGVKGPVNPVGTETVWLDLAFQADASYLVRLPAAHCAFVYVYEGNARVGWGRTHIRRGELAVLSVGDIVQLAARGRACQLLLVAGRPLDEPIVRNGPFVMNTTKEIHQALQPVAIGAVAQGKAVEGSDVRVI